MNQNLSLEETQHKLKGNINKLYWLNSLHMFIVIMPVIVPFFQSRGLSMKNIFELQSIFALGLLFLELPSGYISDLLGRKKTLILAIIFWGVGYTIFPFSRGFMDLAIAEILLAISVSLYSGTDISLLYDSMNALKVKKAPIKILGRMMFYRQMGEGVAALAASALIFFSLSLPVYIQAVVSWLPLMIIFTLFEPPRKKMEKSKHKENAIYIFNSLFRHSRLLTLVILNTMIWSLSTLIAVWTFQKYWTEIGVMIGVFGYFWAMTNFTVAIVSRNAHKVEKKLGSSACILMISVLPIVGYFGMSKVEVWWGAFFSLLFQISRGLNNVILKDALNKRVSGDMRATANSVVGLGIRLQFIFLGPLAGYLIDNKGLQYTFNTFIIIFTFLLFALTIPFLLQRNSFDPVKKKTSS